MIEGAFSQETGRLSETDQLRIRDAYEYSKMREKGGLSPIWQHMTSKSEQFYKSFTNGTDWMSWLDNPAHNYLLFGFENIHLDATNLLALSAKDRDLLSEEILDLFKRLAECMGAIRLWNPELTKAFPERVPPKEFPAAGLLPAIEDEAGCKLEFPNPFPLEYGLSTWSGIASHRALYAIYQAWRLISLPMRYGSKVVEIGAGLGRTAYYARKMGISSYTIVDIPETNVSQANFLMRVLGSENVTLAGEAEKEGTVRIMPTSWFLEEQEKFDLMLNADSFTEMPLETAESYARAFVERCKVLLSINHEANFFTVRSFEPLEGRCIGRFPWWLRPGYVEEIFLGDKA